MDNAKEAWAFFEKLFASERESEEHGLKENSRTVEIDPLTRKFQGVALTQPASNGAGNPNTTIRREENAHM
jgi:hypothetical protein